MRIQQLEKYLSEEPNDPFLKYALATEYLGSDLQKSRYYFEELLDKHDDYIGTYYHAASLYIELGLIENAKKVYLKGIKKAELLEEAHALKELKTAYLNFQFEHE